jgi:post-segregation antitoxin (ccd killing protein)
MKEVLEVFEQHAPYPNLPALLPERARALGLQVSRQVPLPILNATLNDNAFSRWLAPMIKGFVQAQGAISDEELDAWSAEFAVLESKRAYWFSSTPVITEIVKPPT